MGGVELHGMDFSVYTRIVRLALIEKGVDYDLVPLNPFAEDPPDPNRDLHPFGKMPVLLHNGMRIIETQAILRYVDEAFDGPPLQPTAAVDRARQNQVIGICDSYLYKDLVWGVFVETVRKPAEGSDPDKDLLRVSLQSVATAFSTLDELYKDDPNPSTVTLADFFLAPIMDYGLRVEAAAQLVMGHPHLCQAWRRISGLASMKETQPIEFTRLLPDHTLL